LYLAEENGKVRLKLAIHDVCFLAGLLAFSKLL